MEKIEKLRKVLKNKGLDAIYINSGFTRRYFSGFTGTAGVILVTEKEALFFADFRYIEQANKQVVPNGYEVKKIERHTAEEVTTFIKEAGIKKMGIEDKEITLAGYNSMVKKYEGVELIPLEDSLANSRLIKNAEEIELIKGAAGIADRAFARIKEKIKAGVSESEIAAELEYIMKLDGAEDRSFETIVASGVRSAMPHGVASDKKIMNDEFVKLDFGCYYKGYVSDITRTVYLGKNITSRHMEIYNIVLEAQLMALKYAKAGMTTKELDLIARDYIASKGYGDNFGHGLGHGIGLEVHEEPSLSQKTEEIRLEENMVVIIEPGIYIEGFGGVRIEDDIVIKNGGCEILTKSPKELIIL